VVTFLNRAQVLRLMGFKAKARKHKSDAGETNDSTSKKTKKEGEIPCGVNTCDKFADKSFGGRSLSIDNAIDVWCESGYTQRKGRVRVCKSCYRKWKKDSSSEDSY
jgi:hypothetical protein